MALSALLVSGSLGAATLAHSSDFEGSNKDGWQRPRNSGNQTSIQTDGPFNSILLNTSGGGMGPGSRLIVPNSSPNWTGNYSTAGITGVQMDLVNNSGLTLSMRVGIEGGAAGNLWASITPVTLTPSQRGTFRFDIDPSSMSAAQGGDFAATISDVTQIRIFHNPNTGDFKGAAVPGSFTVDNITLVPEPSSTTILFVGCVILLTRRTR